MDSKVIEKSESPNSHSVSFKFFIFRYFIQATTKLHKHLQLCHSSYLQKLKHGRGTGKARTGSESFEFGRNLVKSLQTIPPANGSWLIPTSASRPTISSDFQLLSKGSQSFVIAFPQWRQLKAIIVINDTNSTN